MEPIRQGGASINSVRSKESRGTCKASKGRGSGSAGNKDYVVHHRQEADLGRHLEV